MLYRGAMDSPSLTMRGSDTAPVGSPELDMEVLARIGRALADETRRRILVRLLSGAVCPSDLADELATTRANISNHLTCLRGCGLVVGRTTGRHVHYELVDGPFAGLLDGLGRLDLRMEDDT